MNKLEQKIYNLSRELKCVAREVCSLSEGGNTETDPIFTASPSFGITSPDIANWNEATSLMHEHSNMATLSGITAQKVINWDSAFTATQSLSTTYFPLLGGTLTGINGNGFIGLPQQASEPTAPAANSLRIFSNNTGQFSILNSGGFAASLSTSALTTDKVFTIPDIAGGFVMDAGTQTISGTKTFSNTITSASILPNANGTRTLGNASFQYQATYTQSVLGTSLFLTTIGATNMGFGINSGATLIGTWYSNGNLFVGTGTQTDGGFKFDVNGTSRLNGAVTLGGNFVPNGDNTLNIGSTTARMAVVYTINVSKGNAGNSFNLAVTNTTDIYMRVQPTTNNVVFQAAGVAPSETGYKVTIDGTGAANGAFSVTNGVSIFGGNILSSGASTLDIGSTTNKFNNVYTNAVNANGTLLLRSSTTNSILLSQTSTSAGIFGQFFANTGALGLQSPGSVMTDDAVNRLQVAGSIKATQYRLSTLNTAPTTAADTGTLGEIRIDADHIYVATATNTWKRAALTTW